MIKSSGCIVVKIFDGEPYILLVHASGNWKNKQFGIPKGLTNQNEPLARAAIRETLEETGITPKIIKYVGYVDLKSRNKRVYAYLAKIKNGKINDKKQTIDYDESEVDVSKFYPLEQAIGMLYTYQKPLLIKAKNYIEEHIHDF